MPLFPIRWNSGHRCRSARPGWSRRCRAAAAPAAVASPPFRALGSGLMETRALLSFLPRIARELQGDDLSLPNIATWWCGQEAERSHVLANIDRMVVGPALLTRLA